MKWLLILALTACQPSPTDPPAPPDASADYQSTSERLVEGFIDRDRVISRKPDWSPGDLGDGLIFAGIALAALPCELADELEAGLAHEIFERGGIISRHPDIPDEASLDGALGLWRGIAERVTRCGRADVWRYVVEAHRNFIMSRGGILNPGDGSRVIPEFRYVLDLLANRLGTAGEPEQWRLRVLEAELAAWSRAVTLTHAACFRIHLGYLALSTVQVLGGAPSRAAFCAASADGSLPLVDHWCGRSGLHQWLDAFTYNEWSYRHQRCGAWESPDGAGWHRPGLDKLMAMRAFYPLP